MNFCSQCGDPVVLKVPPGDNRPRYVCDGCDTVHYQNPCIVAGCLPVWEEKVLLCRRAIEPGYGLWTLPAGFMELGETTREAAVREALEEANAVVEIDGLYTLLDLPRIGQVYMLFRARLPDGSASPGDESLETRLFDESEIPWEGIAFTTIVRTLRRFFQDRRRGDYPLFTDTITLEPGVLK